MVSYQEKIHHRAEQATSVCTPAMLKKLEEHKYKSSDASPLDFYVMQHFWNKMVSYAPLWLAPNLITTIGLAVNVAVTLFYLSYCPNMEGEAPRYIYLLVALSVFFYQTMDAIDGKQARRTGTGSCLGELFDHGCDAISNTMVVAATVTTAQMGATGQGAIVIVSFLVAFYCAQWQTFVTGELEFGWIDVTEGQFLMMAIHLLTFKNGVQMWDTPVYGDMQLKHVAALCGMFGSLTSMLRNMYTIFYKNERPTVAGTSVLQPSFVPACVVAMFYYIFTWGRVVDGAPGSLYREASILVVVTFGCVIAKMSVWLVIAHMTKHPHKYWDKTMWVLVFLCINTRCEVIDQHTAMLVACVYVHLSMSHFCYHVCRQICAHFKLRVFHIPYPNKACPGFVESAANVEHSQKNE